MNTGRLEEHVIPLCPGWSLWRTVWLRSAGFPMKLVSRLACPNAAAAIDQLLEAETICAERARTAIDVCRPGLQKAETRAAISKAIKALQKGRLPNHPTDPAYAEPAIADAFATFSKARADYEELAAAAPKLFEKDSEQAMFNLREEARRPLFREAVLWQNKNALELGIEKLEGSRPHANSETRAHERVAANYLQRYCVKNDTIGFFGPVAWARINPEGPAIALEPKERFLSKRTVYFELWCIDALAEIFAREAEIKIHLRPRRQAFLRVEGTMVHYGDGRTAEIPEEFAQILQSCDGEKTAQEIAGQNEDPDEVYEMLEELVDKKLAVWDFALPVWDPRPELSLQKSLENIPDNEAKTRALEGLSSLIRAKDELARAAGDVEASKRALVELEKKFVELTGVAASRREGATYAGRTLVYEDCVRDVSLSFGPGFVEKIGPCLSLLLHSARWYTHAVAQKFRKHLTAIYRRLAAAENSRTIDYLKFWHHVAPELGSKDDPPELVRAIGEELQAGWAELLDIPADAKQIERSAAALGEKLRARFPAPHAGWPLARYNSPDLMIAASSAEAMARGEYRAVIGEVHVAVSSLFSQVSIAQHPAPHILFEGAGKELPEPNVMPLESKAHALRADYVPMKHEDLQLETGETRSASPREQVLIAAELVVEEVDDRVIIRERNGARSFEMIEFLQQYFVATHSGLHILPHRPHLPRITVDSVVIARERWTFTPEDLPFDDKQDPYTRFVEARRWQKRCGMPRRVFVRVPEEVKPFYLDFDSRIYVEIFVRCALRASRVSVSEMLPEMDEAWFTDAAGDTYAAELRTTAFDLTSTEA